jgi:hypothetical protein
MAMAIDRDLQLRGRLVRSLGALREMLPGSYVERRRKCGKANCRCADDEQQHLHVERQLSLLVDGKHQSFHIHAELAEEVRNKVELRKRFQKAADKICELNLKKYLARRGKP